MRVLSALLAVLLLSTSNGYADLPSIRFDRLKPLGAAAGTEIEVEIQGSDIEEVTTLLFDHPGLTATPVPDKERRFVVKIAADVPPGTYDVYLSGRFGVSNPRLFAVSTGLVDVLDNSDNRTFETAQPVEMNSAINGTVDGNAEDFYRFTARAGQRIVIDCEAQRLDSEFDATLSLRNAEGAPVASNGDYFGQDPLIDYVVPADGDYFVAISDLSYRGGFPYRLSITDRPRIENVFPPAAKAGESAEFEFLGRNLAAIGGEPSAHSIDGLPLDRLRVTLPISAEILELGTYRFANHPTHHSVLPTAATCTLTGVQIVPESLAATWNAQPILVTRDPVTIEAEPNDTADKPQPITIPAVVAGRFDAPQDADWYEFTADDNAQYQFDVYCERIAGRADPYLVVMDDQGNRIAELDDYGHRVNGFDGHLRDPSQGVNLGKDRKYRVLVQDRYRRGGPRYQYVLEIRKPTPDFYAAIIHSHNQNPAGTTIFKGTPAYVDVVLHQKGGFNGTVKITAEGLPTGVHCAPAYITNNNRGQVVFWSDDDAADWTGFVRLYAEGTHDGATFRREVRPHSRVWNNSGTSRPSRQLALAVREHGPFDLRLEPAEITVEAGQSVEMKLHARRLWPDFKEKITIQPLQFPGQFKLGNFDVGNDQAEARVKLEVQQNTRPGEYTLTLLGQAQVPFSKDRNSESRPNTLVSTPSRPVTIRVTEAAKK